MRDAGRRRGALVGLVAAMAVTSAWLRETWGQTCSQTSQNFISDVQRGFKINTQNLGALNGVTADEVERAIVMAATTWNERASSGTFRYLGKVTVTDPSSTAPDIPVSATDCSNQGITYSLVTVDTSMQNTHNGRTHSRCGGTQFTIRIYKYNDDGTQKPWQVTGDNIGPNNLDAVSTLIHEFGHTFKVGHTDEDGGSGEYGIMWGAPAPGSNRRREPYWWDIKCVLEVGGFRSGARARARTQNADGTFGSESSFLGSWQVPHISVGRTWVPSGAYSASGHVAGQIFWARGLNTTGTNYFPSSEHNQDKLAETTAAVFREDTSQDRVFFATWDEAPTNGDEDSAHWMRYRRSSNGFASSSSGGMRECSSMTGFYLCPGGGANLSAALPPAVAWDDDVQRSVFAWVNHNRLDDSNTNKVRLAYGYVSDDLLPVASASFGKSNVTPGVACKKDAVRDEAGGVYDCMIAVAPPSDAGMNIRVYRFKAVASSVRYAPSVSPYVFQFALAPTATRIAAWYNNGDGKFWIAYRSLEIGNNLVVRSSADTTAWTGSGGVPGSATYPDTGPTTVNYASLSGNQLVYSR